MDCDLIKVPSVQDLSDVCWIIIIIIIIISVNIILGLSDDNFSIIYYSLKTRGNTPKEHALLNEAVQKLIILLKKNKKQTNKNKNSRPKHMQQLPTMHVTYLSYSPFVCD